jgi:exodeoxyribonuclease VII small subunit
MIFAMSRKKEEPAAEVDFETSMAELESIVEALENDSLSLAEMISQYERGSHLLSNCDAFLKSAKLRLEKLTIREENENVLASDPDLCHVPPTAMPPNDKDDDSISLF